MATRSVMAKKVNQPVSKKRVPRHIPKKMSLPVIVTCDGDGYFCAEVPVIRGFTQGKTKEEALTNIQEVIRVCLAHTESQCESTPVEYMFEQVDVTI